ncbi:hypothetical protein HYV81_03230 [Candidatus Woesearchaeota archaeon]|nr:hypothetical protein [Candidatus Woesearchaeota archaeon]
MEEIIIGCLTIPERIRYMGGREAFLSELGSDLPRSSLANIEQDYKPNGQRGLSGSDLTELLHKTVRPEGYSQFVGSLS